MVPNGVKGIIVFDDYFSEQHKRLDSNRTIYNKTTFSSCHIPHTPNILHPVTSYHLWNYKKLFQAGNFNGDLRSDICCISFYVLGVYSKIYTKSYININVLGRALVYMLLWQREAKNIECPRNKFCIVIRFQFYYVNVGITLGINSIYYACCNFRDTNMPSYVVFWCHFLVVEILLINAKSWN